MAAAATSSAFEAAGTPQHSAFHQLLDAAAALNISGSSPAQQQPTSAPHLYSEAQMHEFAFRVVAAAQQTNPTAAGMNTLLAMVSDTVMCMGLARTLGTGASTTRPACHADTESMTVATDPFLMRLV
jgi:hypothetical protein